MREKDFSKIETKSNICINVFCYENRLVFPIYISDLKFENTMDLLVVNNGGNHIMCTSKVLTDKYLTKYTFTKIKTKNTFAKVAYSILVVKMC